MLNCEKNCDIFYTYKKNANYVLIELKIFAYISINTYHIY